MVPLGIKFVKGVMIDKICFLNKLRFILLYCFGRYDATYIHEMQPFYGNLRVYLTQRFVYSKAVYKLDGF